jgi:hypothetical protein
MQVSSNGLGFLNLLLWKTEYYNESPCAHH